MRMLSYKSKYLLSLLGLSLIGLGLLGFGALQSGTLAYSYLIWNLFLSWLPLGASIWLVARLKHKLWSSWETIAISLIWLLFLPNSFYMISDFIHIVEVPIATLLYDVLTFVACIAAGVLLGFTSLYIVHREFIRRFGHWAAAWIVGGILLACSFGVYIGRDLRWNSWDIFFNPSGLIFDVTDRLVNLQSYPNMVLIVLSFFVLLAGLYTVIWHASRLLQQQPKV